MPTYPSLKPCVDRPNLFGNQRNSFHAFTQENSIQELTLDELSRTNHEKDPRTGSPSLNGVHHDDFITHVMRITEREGYVSEITELFAAQNSVLRLPGVTVIREIEEEKGPLAIEAHILRRIFASIKLGSPRLPNDEKQSYPCIAIAYHQKGIQVGLGMKVMLCHNQMLLNADSYIATFDDGISTKVEDYRALYEAIRVWIRNLSDAFTEEQKIIDRLKGTLIEINTLRYIFGVLVEEKTRFESSNLVLTKLAPVMNFGQIKDFSEEALKRLYTSPHLKVSLWDLYDIATNALKPWLTTDFPSILSQNRGFANLLLHLDKILRGEMNLNIPVDKTSPIDVLHSLSQRLKEQINQDINRIFHETIDQRLDIR